MCHTLVGRINLGGLEGIGALQGQGTVIKYEPVKGSDVLRKDVISIDVNTYTHCITAAISYQNKSLEVNYESIMTSSSFFVYLSRSSDLRITKLVVRVHPLRATYLNVRVVDYGLGGKPTL